MLLTNLPAGFTFIGPPGLCTEEYIIDQIKNEALAGNENSASAAQKLEQTADSSLAFSQSDPSKLTSRESASPIWSQCANSYPVPSTNCLRTESVQGLADRGGRNTPKCWLTWTKSSGRRTLSYASSSAYQSPRSTKTQLTTLSARRKMTLAVPTRSRMCEASDLSYKEQTQNARIYRQTEGSS